MSFDVENYFSDIAVGSPILYFKGNIDSDLINSMLDLIEEKLVSVNENPKLRKKVYNVLVESLQNLYHHVDKVPEGFEDQVAERFGIFSLLKVDDGYKIVTGNFVKNEGVKELEEKLLRINNSTHEEITELYKFILNHQRISSKGGGGLGLVDIARKTCNKLEYVFKVYDEHNSFFCLNILVDDKK